MTKLWECFKKYSSLAFFTRSESQLNASEWLYLSALFQGRTSHLLGLGGSSGAAWGMVLLGGLLSTRLGEACCLLGLGDCLGMGEGGAVRAGCSSVSEILATKEMRGCGGLPQQNLVGGHQHVFELHWAGI